uniref:Uncharacterized protein n=1 Tax=Cacopsylla melanoneura TaxID=428564 RepID=A0A8D8QR90_9HEMI
MLSVSLSLFLPLIFFLFYFITVILSCVFVFLSFLLSPLLLSFFSLLLPIVAPKYVLLGFLRYAFLKTHTYYLRVRNQRLRYSSCNLGPAVIVSLLYPSENIGEFRNIGTYNIQLS